MFGQVSSIAGTATVKDANGQIRQLKLGDEVHAGDVVSTSAGSRVQIDCADQSSFEIPPNAEFLIAVECLSSEVDGSEWSVSEETVGALAGAIESGDGVDFLEAIRTGDLVPGEVDGDELLEAALGPDIDIGAGPSGGAHSFVRLGRIVLDLSEQGVDADTDAEVSQEEVVGANNLEVNPEPEPEPEPEPPTPEPAGPVILSITGPESVLEGDVTAPYTLSLVDDEGNAIVAETDIVVTVTYTGTATDGSDYTSETPITIAAGSSSATFDLQTLDDVIADNGETIVLTISTEDDGGFEDLQLGNDEVTTIIIDDSNPDTPDNPDEPDQEAVTLSITGPESVLEGDVTAPYTLSLVDDEGNAIVAETDIVVTVTYTGTATDGSDYTSETPITIAAGSSSATFDLQTLDDVIADNGETIVLTISTEDDGGFEDLQLGNDEVTTIIIDDSNPDTPDNPDEPDQEAVTLSITGPESVLEGDVTAPYTLSLVDDEGNAIVAETDIVVTVTYTGTATDGSDYTSETPITIAAGSSSATFDLQTLDDVIADNGETIVLTISTEDDGGFEDLQLGNDEVTTIIIDDSNPDTPDNPDEPDQEAVTLSITGPESVLEGDVTAPYTLSLVDDEGNAIVAETDIIITVTYTGTATDGSDYTSETPITIAAGSSSATFDLQTLDDVIADNGETIVLTISTEDDGGFEDLQLGNDEVTTIIIDDSNPDTPDNPDEPDQEAVTLSITGPESVLEGDVTAPYTLSLVDDEGNAIVAETDIIITVTYTGTATDGSDYTSETPITIAAGSSSATFDLQTLDDVIADNGETIVLTISTEDDGGFEDLQLGNDEVTTIIIDADIPLVSISGEYTIIEGETSGTFTVAVDQPASEITSDITVALIYSGVAQDGTDFTGVASVTIAAGTNNVEFTIDTIDDALAEGSESLVITIGEITDTNFEAIAADPDANSVENEIIDETGEDPENPPDVAYRLGLFAVVDGEYVAANEIWEDGGVGTYVVLAVDENGEPLADAEQPGGTVTVAIGPQDGEDNPEVDAANTAERGIDYDSSETVVATVGATFTIAAIDDVLADNGEVFTLALSEDWSRANEFEDVDYVGGVTTTILDETSNDPEIQTTTMR